VTGEAASRTAVLAVQDSADLFTVLIDGSDPVTLLPQVLGICGDDPIHVGPEGFLVDAHFFLPVLVVVEVSRSTAV
jgi:hypothetical protein